MEPGPGHFGFAPKHAHFVIADGSFLDRFHDPGRRLLVAEAMQGESEVPLRLATSQLQPKLAPLAEEKIDGLAMVFGDRPIIEEEAAAVQVERDGRAEV